MGLIKNIRNSYARAKAVARAARAEMETAIHYQNMTCAEAETLPGDTLLECVDFRLERQGGERLLSEPFGSRQAVYTVNLFDREMRKGGLCRYFVDNSRASAPLLEEALTRVGAEPYRKLFHDFVCEHGLDVTNLSDFIIRDIDRYEKLVRKYPFEDFDGAFRELSGEKPLEEYCAAFIRSRLKDFFDK